MIYCKICNYECKNFLGLSTHLRKHKISSKEYYDNYSKKNNEDICYCGDKTSFWNLNKGYKKYCSVKCSRNSKEIIEKIKQTCLEKYGVENPSQSEKVKEKFKETNIKRFGVENPAQSEKVKEKYKETCIKRKLKAHIDRKPIYNFFEEKISWVEKVRRDPEDERFLNVRCKKCEKWFIPDVSFIWNKIQYLKGNSNSEYNIYCSDECRDSCSIFGKHSFQEYHPKILEEVRHPLWAKLVKERDNHTCQRCDEPGNIAHHILPVKTHPFFANDIDNGITVCKKCDKEYFHQLDGCKTSELARKIC